ncbi:hypothetical protein SCUP234_00158 [Seiridium cupressi]
MIASNVIRRIVSGLLAICIVLLILPLGFGPSSQVPLVILNDLGISIAGGDPTIRVGIYGYCVSIEPSSGLGSTCFDPKFGYDVTALQFNTHDGVVKFGIDEAIEGTTSSFSQQNSRSIAILQPLILALDVIAVLVSLRSSRALFISLATCLAFVMTTATISVGMAWVFTLKFSFWAGPGGENASHRGSGALGPAMYAGIVALFLQLVAVLLNIVFCCMRRREQRRQKHQAGSESVTSGSIGEEKPRNEWKGDDEKMTVSSHKSTQSLPSYKSG